MKIRQFKFERKEIDSFEWNIPTQKAYYFETGIRRSICINPRFSLEPYPSEEKSNEIYALDITCIYQNFEAKIESFSINVTQIEELYHQREKTTQSDILRFIVMFATVDSEYTRTKDDFEKDLDDCIQKIKRHIQDE